MVPGSTVTLERGKDGMVGLTIGGGAPYCPCLYVVQVINKHSVFNYLTVQLKIEYSIIPLVHLSLELQPLLQLASSDVNLTCGVINKFSIRSFNSWVTLGLGLWLK